MEETIVHAPYKVAEAEDEDGNASELDGIRQGAMKLLDIIAKHRSQRQWAKALHECDEARRGNSGDFPRQ